MSDRKPLITQEEFEVIRDQDAPFTEYYGFVTEEISHGGCVVRLPYDLKHVRPGGTICGPAMFALADYSMWLAVLSAVGKVPLAVTTNMNINFLRKPRETDLLCHTRLIKLGKRLAVGDMTIIAEGDVEPCAHVTGTYSVPPNRD
ncbi:PaaI family thioesterase [Aestuariispira ectoiniformans]|uniref:PaaI family thioesterase n=1 Tax=Aestuariispira ectoiniformans TaxID=2775080 RepID=UPI00223ADA8A|nr:PaaI family thioesterase [Aestuariispira ectoiniformans]